MQSVIVYRNPLEAMMWEGLMNGSFFPIIVGVVVFFCVFLLFNKILNKGRSIGKTAARNTYISVLIGAVAGIASVIYFI